MEIGENSHPRNVIICFLVSFTNKLNVAADRLNKAITSKVRGPETMNARTDTHTRTNWTSIEYLSITETYQ